MAPLRSAANPSWSYCGAWWNCVWSTKRGHNHCYETVHVGTTLPTVITRSHCGQSFLLKKRLATSLPVKTTIHSPNLPIYGHGSIDRQLTIGLMTRALPSVTASPPQ